MSDNHSAGFSLVRFETSATGRLIHTLVSDALEEGCVLVAEHNFNNGDSVTLGMASRQYTHKHIIVVPSGNSDADFQLDSAYFEVAVQGHIWPGYPQAQDVEAQEQAVTDTAKAFADRLRTLYELSLSNGRS